jgi:hypothetical protein
MTSNIETSDEGIEELYKRIKSIHEANEELIKKIEDNANVQVKRFLYLAPPAISDDGLSCVFKLNVTPVVEPTKKLVSDWRKELDIINIFDIFNLKIDYSGNSYDDLKRLNKEMFDGVERYNMFYDEDSKKGRVELKKFVQNFQTIQKHLEEVISLCKDQPNKSEEIEAILRDANIKMIDAVGAGCRYSPPKIRRISEAIPSVTFSMEQTLSTWIGRSTEKWTLKYRASVDGFGAIDFHKKCDGVARLLVVVQSDKDFVFGGYTGGASFQSFPNGNNLAPVHIGTGSPLFFNGSHMPNQQQQFLFSLINPFGTQPIKCDVTQPQGALSSNSSHCATFGGGPDLLICNNANVQTGSQVNLGHSYMPPQMQMGGASQMFTGAHSGWRVKEVLAFQISE